MSERDQLEPCVPLAVGRGAHGGPPQLPGALPEWLLCPRLGPRHVDFSFSRQRSSPKATEKAIRRMFT